MAVQMKIETHLLNGRRVGQFVDLKPLDEDATLKEAIDNGFLIGKQDLIRANVAGVLKAMAKGVSKDGFGRKINRFLSLQAYPYGRLADICDPVNKDTIEVGMRARMLKEMRIDSGDWSFVIEGANGTFSITSITTGEAMNEIVLGEAIAINGIDLTMGDGDSVSWAIVGTAKSGTVATAKITSAATRINLAADALTGITAAENGKTILITVTIGGKKAVKAATIWVND